MSRGRRDRIHPPLGSAPRHFQGGPSSGPLHHKGRRPDTFAVALVTTLCVVTPFRPLRGHSLRTRTTRSVGGGIPTRSVGTRGREPTPRKCRVVSPQGGRVATGRSRRVGRPPP